MRIGRYALPPLTSVLRHPLMPLLTVRALSVPANLLALGLLSRTLPATEFGVFILFLSAVGIGAVGFGLGVSRNLLSILGEIAATSAGGVPSSGQRHRSAELIAALYLTYGIIMIGVVGVTLFAERFASGSLPPGSLLIFALAGLLTAFVQIVSEALRAYHRFWAGAYFSSIGFTLLLSLVVIACVGVGIDDVATILRWVVAVLCLAAIVAAVLVSRSTGLAWPGHLVADDFSIFKLSLPIFGMDLLILVTNQIDAVLVSVGYGLAVVGEYGKAYRLTAIVGLLMTVQGSLVTPFIPGFRARGDITGAERYIRKWATIMSAIAVAVLATLVLAGPLIGGLVFGRYPPLAQHILYAMAAYQLVNICVGPASEVLIMFGQRWSVFAITAVGSAVALTGMLTTALIVPAGPIIFAWTVALGVATTQIGFLLECRRRTGILTATRSPFALMRRQVAA